MIAGIEDIDDVLSRVESGGGKVAQGKLPVPGMGWPAYVLGLEGNTIGLFRQDTSVAAGQAWPRVCVPVSAPTPPRSLTGGS